ncbi:MAG: hypothetical protein COB36_06915 [Alphaproteobacteria bacterium]|nr:MAG: hypothetical protein COB36_06915 [Alphaproteobacteria bacterium]
MHKNNKTGRNMSENKTLAQFFRVDDVDFNLIDIDKIKQETAHIIIDAQRYFADPTYRHNPDNPDYPQGGGDEKTNATSENIATLVPKFKEAGLQTGWVYFRNMPDQNEDTYGGFHNVAPDKDTDFFAGKSTTSPFEDKDSHFKETLINNGVKNLIVSGFNTSACLYQTVLDALDENFNVCVLLDMTENGEGGDPKLQEKLDHMRAEGAILTDSKQVLHILAEL